MQQEKDETPSAWLERLKKNFRLYSSVDPESQEGQMLIKIQFVTKSWGDIRRKIEKLEDWQEKGLNELLREAQKVYLRREEEKQKSKAKIMVAVAKESVQSDKAELKEEERGGWKPRGWQEEENGGWKPKGWRETIPKRGVQCWYCGEEGHMRSECKKWEQDGKVYKGYQRRPSDE